MITREFFTEKFREMVTLCGFSASLMKEGPIDTYFNSFRYKEQRDIVKGMELIAEDPPNKLTKAALKSFISQASPEQSQSKWNGKECNVEECEMGIISIVRDGNSYAFKCLACKSYDMPAMEYYTEENVCNLEQTIKKMKDNKTVFINKESRSN